VDAQRDPEIECDALRQQGPAAAPPPDSQSRGKQPMRLLQAAVCRREYFS
jgi:hypothetical protein